MKLVAANGSRFMIRRMNMSNINSKQRREYLLNELTRIGYLASLDKNRKFITL
ncbi:hypothetical protein ACEQPO_09675 [Bacillus sp. SL00103]